MPHLPRPTLMLVTDRHLAGGEDALIDAVAAAVQGGVNIVQLRERDLDSDRLLQLAARLNVAISGVGATGPRPPAFGRALLIVNSEIAVARATGALHLPEAASYVRPEGVYLVGRSVHSLEAAMQAEAEGADYVIAGPVFATPSHPGQAPAGPRLISDIAGAVSLPVIAIGGITVERVPEVMAAGASGVAVVSAVLGAESPHGAAAALRDALATIPVGER